MPNPAAEFLLRLQPVATSTGFHSRIYGTVGDDDLVVLNRPGRAGGPHIYVSAGIHGDEPAGPEALIRLLGDFSLLPDATWTLFPMLNPSGYRRGTRENADGLDLNRDYRHPTGAETRAHRAILDQLGNLDLTLSLHEDWESPGFYLYELNATNSEGIATDALEAAGLEGPIDLSPEIDGRPAGRLQLAADQQAGHLDVAVVADAGGGLAGELAAGEDGEAASRIKRDAVSPADDFNVVGPAALPGAVAETGQRPVGVNGAIQQRRTLRSGKPLHRAFPRNP